MQKNNWQLDLGATVTKEGTNFLVWAPLAEELFLEIENKGKWPMKKNEGYFSIFLEEAKASDRYTYLFPDGKRRADPVSRLLPAGVNGPTEIVDQSFCWTDQDWRGIEFDQMVFYELHVGCFSPKENFDGVIKKLFYLKSLGVTCIEIMPIAEFPGRWNWGYDGVSLYAPFTRYGGYAGLKRLVDACHQIGIALCLDVVYTHLGPEGNYLSDFGPYFSDVYRSTWGETFNFDRPYSDDVRRFLIHNALYWVIEHHIDCLRLDALHCIFDFTATSFLEELSDQIKAYGKKTGREIHLVGENDHNDPRLLRKKMEGGLELDALWNDDFHHSLHTLFTQEEQFYYQDFSGFSDLYKTLRQNFVYGNRYSTFRKRHHGAVAADLAKQHFVVFSQNHDQIGNRSKGERLVHISHLPLELEPYLVLLHPSLPLIFMGQEYGEKEPFCYFVDFDDEQLMQRILEGRKKEFDDPEMLFPGEEAYRASMLSWKIDEAVLNLYKNLLAIRKEHLPEKELIFGKGFFVYADISNSILSWEYRTKDKGYLQVVVNCGEGCRYSLPFKKPGKLLHSSKKVEIENGVIEFTEPLALVLYQAT